MFIWNFKHRDNIHYNFKILAALYKAMADSKKKNLFYKPVTIQIVSIIEAIFIDFLIRIDQATGHLPKQPVLCPLGLRISAMVVSVGYSPRLSAGKTTLLPIPIRSA